MISFFKKKDKTSSGMAVLLVGLGNPGGEYAGHRHNAGFMAVDAIAASLGFSSFKNKFQGDMTEGVIEGSKAVLIKPMTYMNNSGQSVKATAGFYKIPPANVIVFHDELDLQPGKLRVKQGGGNAGHNGLKSIQAHLGTADFWRVRIGIGHPGDREKVHGYVLHDFSKEDKKWLGPLLDACGRHAGLLVKHDMPAFMSKVAQDTQMTED